MLFRLSVPICRLALAFIALHGSSAWAQENDSRHIQPGDPELDTPAFAAYEAEYTSAFGRFTHQVRPVRDQVISVLNIIETPQGVIVDHRGLDAVTLRMTYFYSPYFAWGQEYVVGNLSETGYDWTRVSLEGGVPRRITGAWDSDGVFEGLGFSPTLASLMPMEPGERFSLPYDEPTSNGQVMAGWMTFEVMGREVLSSPAGVECECWILEQQDSSGSVTRFWVDRHAPFIFRRHRDIGGPRDFVSDLLSFRPL